MSRTQSNMSAAKRKPEKQAPHQDASDQSPQLDIAVSLEQQLREVVWRDLAEQFPQWQAQFEKTLQLNCDWKTSFEYLVSRGCDAHFLRLQLFSYTRMVSSFLAKYLERMRVNAERLDSAAGALELAAESIGDRCDDLGLSDVWPKMFGFDEPLPCVLHALSELYSRTGNTYRQLSDARGSEQIYTGMFLVRLVEHVKSNTGTRQLTSVAHLVNAARAACGQKCDVQKDTLKKQLKSYQDVSARHGIGASFFDLFDSLPNWE